jgi:hypothetical protein
MKIADNVPFIEAEDFDPSHRDASFFGATAGSFMKHAPWINNLVQVLPNSILETLHPAMASFVAQKRASPSSIPSQPYHLTIINSSAKLRTNQRHHFKS